MSFGTDRPILRRTFLGSAAALPLAASPPPAEEGDSIVRGIESRRARLEAHAGRWPEPYRTIEEDRELWSTPPSRISLDMLIDEDLLKDFRPGDPDRAIWHEGRLLVLIRHTDDGQVELIRFDQPREGGVL